MHGNSRNMVQIDMTIDLKNVRALAALIISDDIKQALFDLTAEIEQLRDALEPFAQAARDAGIDPYDATFDNKFSHVRDMALMRGQFRRVLEVLGE